MAFSTLKDFFNVPFMNENAVYDCKKACVKLKSYESTTDHRSWAIDEAKQSKFLSDLVACSLPPNLGGSLYNITQSNDVSYVLNAQEQNINQDQNKNQSWNLLPNKSQDRNQNWNLNQNENQDQNQSWNLSLNKSQDKNQNLDLNQNKSQDQNKKQDQNKSQDTVQSKYQNQSQYQSLDQNHGLSSLFAGLTTGDSLLQCANVHLAEYQKVLDIKTSLEKQLEVSNERLNTANEENKKIQEILASKLDSNTTKDFFNKIQKLTTAGKLGKNEENEMLQIYQKMENLYKSYEILQAENNYLRRLIDKLHIRTQFESVQTEPEKSNDVTFLQKEVNNLRKECILLRQMEDDYQKIKQKTNKSKGISDQDAENIKAIIKERNSLREKCKTFESMKKKVQDLEKQTHDANREAGRLSSTLSNQSQLIDRMEGEIRSMQSYYEDKCQNACFTEECLRTQIDDLKDELIKAKCEAQKADMLAMEIASLRKELLDRDLALNDFDCQYKQLMYKAKAFKNNGYHLQALGDLGDDDKSYNLLKAFCS